MSRSNSLSDVSAPPVEAEVSPATLQSNTDPVREDSSLERTVIENEADTEATFRHSAEMHENSACEETAPNADDPTSLRHWQAAAESVVGLAHRRCQPPLPCQDASDVYTQPRLGLFVADGAGSAPLSDVGSRTAVRSLRRLCLSLDDQIVEWLDFPSEPDTTVLHRFALRCAWHVLGSLEDEAQALRRPLRDFRCTLLMMLAGKERIFWLKVGDGALVIEQAGSLAVVGSLQKGEFANQTRFIDDHLTPNDVEFGSLPANDVSGLALMTDGAADRLVAQDGSRASGLLARFIGDLRDGRLKRTDLTEFFYDHHAWLGTSGDDKTLALAAR